MYCAHKLFSKDKKERLGPHVLSRFLSLSIYLVFAHNTFNVNKCGYKSLNCLDINAYNTMTMT